MRIKDMKFRTKVAVGATMVAASIAGGGVAFAYFTGGNGTGTGDATTSATAPNVGNLTSTVSATGITYDGNTSVVSVTVNNPNPYSVSFTSVTVSVDDTKLPTNCAAGSFTVSNSGQAHTGAVGPGTVVIPGTLPVTGITIKFNDEQANNQQGCVAATISKYLTAQINA
jgi:hypothetical protein